MHESGACFDSHDGFCRNIVYALRRSGRKLRTQRLCSSRPDAPDIICQKPPKTAHAVSLRGCTLSLAEMFRVKQKASTSQPHQGFQHGVRSAGQNLQPGPAVRLYLRGIRIFGEMLGLPKMRRPFSCDSSWECAVIPRRTVSRRFSRHFGCNMRPEPSGIAGCKPGSRECISLLIHVYICIYICIYVCICCCRVLAGVTPRADVDVALAYWCPGSVFMPGKCCRLLFLGRGLCSRRCKVRRDRGLPWNGVA